MCGVCLYKIYLLFVFLLVLLYFEVLFRNTFVYYIMYFEGEIILPTAKLENNNEKHFVIVLDDEKCKLEFVQ